MYLLSTSGPLRYFVLFTFILFACLLTELTPSLLIEIIQWGKSHFCLSCTSPKPFWSATFLPWPDPCVTLCGTWAVFHDHVSGYVISSDTVCFAIRHNMPWVSILVLLDGSNMINFYLPITMWCTMIIFLPSVNQWFMHLWACWILVKCYAMFNQSCFHTNVL